MKKTGVALILSIFILNFIALNLVLAQEQIPGLPSGLDPEKIEEKKEKAEEKTEYLKQEWRNILLKNPITWWILNFSDKVLNPISKLFLKREISFSWVYLFILAIWVTIVIIAYKPLVIGLNMKSVYALLSGAIIATLAIRVIPDKWFEFQLSLIWKVVILGIILLIIASNKAFTDYLEKAMKKETEEKREMKAKLVEKLHDIEIKANR